MDITGRLTHDAQVTIHAIRGAGLSRPREISLHPEVRAEILKSATIPTVTYMLRETFLGMEIIQDPSLPKGEAQIRYLDRERKPQIVRILLDTPLVVNCYLCGGDSDRICPCHDGQGSSCDMICNP